MYKQWLIRAGLGWMAAIIVFLSACDRGTPDSQANSNNAQMILVKGTGGGEDDGSEPLESGARNVVYDPDPGSSAAMPPPPPPMDPNAAPDPLADMTQPPTDPIPAPTGGEQDVQLRYAILLEGDPTMQPRAPENIRFSTGQRFCFLMIPSRNLHLYLFHEGANGAYSLLNPIPGQTSSVELLTAQSTQRLPLQGWFRMDENTGIERIHIVAAPKKLPRVELLLENGANANQSAAVKQTLDALRQAEEVGYQRSKKVETVFSELIMSGEQVADGVIVGTIEMKHQ